MYFQSGNFGETLNNITYVLQAELVNSLGTDNSEFKTRQ